MNSKDEGDNYISAKNRDVIAISGVIPALIEGGALPASATAILGLHRIALMKKIFKGFI